MKYLLFCCHEEKTLDSMSKSECECETASSRPPPRTN
jgi:hypothetical protein